MDKILRNYIGLTLLLTSFILFFVDMKSGIIVNVMSIIAFAYTEQITSYIARMEKKHTDEKEFYDVLEKFNYEKDKDSYDALEKHKQDGFSKNKCKKS